MAKSSRIKVMISSRCNDMFPLSSKPQVRLSDLRTKMKKEIEGTTVLGSRPFEVWINEDAAESAELDAWDECMRQARECDIFVDSLTETQVGREPARTPRSESVTPSS
jgi:hypothetical protein